MINLKDIHQWQRLAAGEMFDFPSDRARPVKLEVNASAEVAIYIDLKGEEEPRLLALVKGRETLNFVVPGAFTIFHEGDAVDVYFLTADGARVHRENMGADAYTKLHERRAVSPEFEYMRWQMEYNMKRRMDAMAAQFEASINAIQSGQNSTGADDSGAAGGTTEPTASVEQPVGDGTAGGVSG
ncbi:hypothetical protein [Rhizobium phage RHph_X94]|nr:hypothetical protein EVB28_002 [Rhizobium phage RHph_TM23]QIG67232.1 hypothetical protein EVB36_002 [Rhizobium phage RHph_TM36]QIG67460.1 hypothetical protein EVB40_002 [Rhizobium phage RHph_TM3_3_14A]QIG67563.1 hypothetical protein EVB43_002 [Rhizobium phage RHph_TM3_3_4B]QIG67591.1 hypothetical protein EVB47_002 [Rhizobium phage RHph_TM3_3_7A]QIG67605.1 hypothetical protein EVB49_002 [Rhizobium phage RHph_TM1_10A]QWY82949.1 hypothetical protein [Rhizobium phage RHph_X94]